MNSFIFKKYIIFGMFVLVLVVSTHTQAVVINEFMASNGLTIADEDGDYEDWIELYNSGSQAVNLEGYGLTDDLDEPFQWVFPDINIEPGEYLLVWASNKDHCLEQGAVEPHTNFAISREGEPLQLTAPDGTIVDSVGPLELPRDISYGRVTDGGDQWGYFDEPTPRASNSAATAYEGIADAPYFSQENGFYTDSFDLVLSSNEFNTDIYYTLDGSIPTQENYSGIVEPQPYDGNGLGAWWIDDDELVQISLETHVSLMFGDKNWDDYEITLQAKKTSGGEGFRVFFRSTDTNCGYLMNFGGWGNTLHGIEKEYDDGNWDIITQVEGSVNAGQWYDIRVRVEGNHIQCYLNDEKIFDYEDSSDEPYLHGKVGVGTWATQARYRDIEVKTLNGDILYSGMPIDGNMVYDALPGITIDNSTNVVRARTYKDDYIPSRTVTSTYFVEPGIDNRFTMPVISIATEPGNFFDPDYGIYVNGNYWERGFEWERPIHISFFEPDGQVGFSQDAGVRIHGGYSRDHPQKSLRLYARGSVYETSHFEHQVFSDCPFDAYKRFILRNSGNDNFQTMFRDAMMQSLVGHLRFDTQAYRPSVLFLNGQYWGIHNIRERYDKHYLGRNYAVDPENLDILEWHFYFPLHQVKAGTDNHYVETIDYIETYGLADPNHYEYIKTRIDIENFKDYNIAQVYFNNRDWPNNNNDFWRNQTDQYERISPYGHDGRWRWLLFDTDWGFGHHGSYDTDTLAHATASDSDWAFNRPASTFLLRKLLENDTFRNKFINRFADQLNTAFLPGRVISVIDEMQAAIADEIPMHGHRWGTLGNWHYHVDVMRNFGNNRPSNMRRHISRHFRLSQPKLLTIDIENTGHGYVRVNTIDVIESTLGVDSAPYPWMGLYFPSVPITVQAKAKPGYRFSHWQELEGSQAQSRTVTLDVGTGTTLTAVFEEVNETLLYYWHFNDLPDDEVTSVPADHPVSSNALITYAGTGDGYMDDTSGCELNLRLGRDAGKGLRVRNPSDDRELVFTLPTTGHEDIRFSYAVRRTTNGAQAQAVEYRTTAGGDWQQIGDVITITEDYQLFSFDFTDIEAVNDNPDFQIRILFGGDNASGTSGNNRFDNITVEGVAVEDYGFELEAGDIMIIAANAVAEEEFAWVPLVDIPAGTRINFTDSSYGSVEDGLFYDMFRWSEHLDSEGGGPLTWSHSEDVAAGTVIKLLVEERFEIYYWNIGWHSGSQPHLSSSGEQLFAYQGDIVENTDDGYGNYVGDYSNTNMIYGINWANFGWAESGSGSTNDSYIPNGLSTSDNTAVHLGYENNYYYEGPLEGSREYLLEQVSQTGNWVGDDGYREGGYLDLLPGSFGEPFSLLHFWCFTDDLDNNTPFEDVYSLYNMAGTAFIEYHSALDGYPFFDGHPNWRRASMERRNQPTEINYRPEGNEKLDYDEDFMRGLQVRQPFRGDAGENTMIFHLPTNGYKDVVFRFAAMDEGAADGLIVDYSVSSGEPQWQTSGLNENTFELWENIYHLYEIDFSSIAEANDNPNFKIRIRFDVVDGYADDGNRVTFNNVSLDGSLIYPEAHILSMGPFKFDYWSSGNPEHTFPDNMLFLQTNLTDPGVDAPLEYAYFIPHDDYHSDDIFTIGYPYNNTRRTRLNGLNDGGISFINTGRDRDLGGALLALDTRCLGDVRLSWENSTVFENSRQYAIRLQYRVGHSGEFQDVEDDDGPVEYMVNEDDHGEEFEVWLPEDANNEPYVQLLWRYYHVDITEGPRAELRLDNISVWTAAEIADLAEMTYWWLNSDCDEPDFCAGADFNRDGRVDMQDIALLGEKWLAW